MKLKLLRVIFRQYESDRTERERERKGKVYRKVSRDGRRIEKKKKKINQRI